MKTSPTRSLTDQTLSDDYRTTTARLYLKRARQDYEYDNADEIGREHLAYKSDFHVAVTTYYTAS